MYSLADQRFSDAKVHLANENHPRAIEELRAALSVATNEMMRSEIGAELDSTLLSLGQSDVAEATWSFELQRTPPDQHALELLVEAAIRTGRFTAALIRLEGASQYLSREKLLFQQIRCRIGQFKTVRAQELVDSDPSMPKVLADKFRIQILFSDRRHKEALSLLSTRPNGRSLDLLRLRIQALIGTGRYEEVEKELNTHREFYPEQAWIDYELARNATMAKWRSLAVSRWSAILESDDASDIHLKGYVEALIDNLEVVRATSIIDQSQSRFKRSTISELQNKVLVANGEYDRAIGCMQEAIRESEGSAPDRIIARFSSELSALELRRYAISGDAQWLDRHLQSAKAALNFDTEYYPTKIKLIDALIRCDQHDKALEEIARLPENYRPENLRLAMWRADRAKNNEAARKSWVLRRRIHYIPQIEDGKKADLIRLDENTLPQQNDLTLYTVVRNEEKRLNWFLDYYRKLGVRNFMFVDNGSTDSSVDILRNQPDVILFSTQQSYVAAFAGMVWLNYLKNTHSRLGWALYVDVDEALVFDDCENRSIHDLIEVLETQSSEAFSAFMLDMFAAPSGNIGSEDRGTDFIVEYPNYLARHFQNPAPVCPYRNIRGGARMVFGTGEELTKTPLVKVSSGVDFLRSSHNITPAKVSGYSGTLLHFKLIDGLQAEANAVLNDLQRSADCQLRYRKYLFNQGTSDLLSELNRDACTYQGSEGLIRNGLISRIEEFHAGS